MQKALFKLKEAEESKKQCDPMMHEAIHEPKQWAEKGSNQVAEAMEVEQQRFFRWLRCWLEIWFSTHSRFGQLGRL